MSLELRKVEEEEELESSSSSSSSRRSSEMREEEVSSSSRKRRERSWDDKFILNGLRVVLVEGDDSTRHIIAALLRKCNYKVAAVSDGLRAWEILKEKPESIDVVLAEVEIPSISGISLLSMMTDRESCKHIPVIMMSSHDSVNMVFNCMLKGAADFLVKPIRKNELRNLWQHVWRRQTSSCTRSDMEVESMCKQSNMEPQQITCKDSSHISEIIYQNGEWKYQQNAEEFIPLNEACTANEQLMEEEQSCALVDTTPQRQVIDLIGTIDNQQGSYWQSVNSAKNDNLYDTPEVFLCDEDLSCNQNLTPLLELSLRRYNHNHVDEEEKNGCRVLNHSTSSAFSLYNGRILVSPPITGNLQAECEENYSPTTKHIPEKGFNNCGNIQMGNERVRHLNTKDAKSPNVNSSNQNGIAIECSPIRLIPLPIPVRGVNLDKYHASMQPILYPDSSDHQTDTRDLYICHQQLCNQSSTSNSICDASVDYIDGSGNSISTTNMPNITSKQINQGEKKLMDLYCLNQRAAALNKFRLKRKDRCFEKKVRYQSRKRLAEQRPRIKGQFVRHIQTDTTSTETSSYNIDPDVR